MSLVHRTRAAARPAVTAALALLALLAVALAAPAARAYGTHTTVTSFDGTRLTVNFFPAFGLKAGHRAPTVLIGPGWGGTADTNVNGQPSPSVGYPGLGTLLHHGFNVVTWDPRGFGTSTGRAHVDNPRFEGRDVSALISWLARRPQALLDQPGDPRVGMAGGSYGGGIQLVAAAIDRRIDAIVPDIAWHSLLTSLDKNDTVKLGWSSLLYVAALASGMRMDPLITRSYQTSLAGQPLTAAEKAFYRSAGPGNLVGRIRAPTLLIEGTVDNLFSLQEAVDNYTILRRNHVPVHMLWFCGGHGVCLTNPGNGALIAKYTLAWLDRYLKRQPRVRTGPGFAWVDQLGGEHASASYPPPAGAPLLAHGRGNLILMQAGGSGPAKPPAGGGTLGTAAAAIAPARAANAVNVTLPAPARATLVAGAPLVTLTYRGRGSLSGTRVFAQVVDGATGLVLGNQITPIPVRLDGKRHTVTLPLEIVAARDLRGEHFILQVTASTVLYAKQAATGRIHFRYVGITLPTLG